ncbi:hypothetical protein NE237_023605 [Protea cynaroides]|uniref:Uncharacterized protein n=1 Tax=Protea cynaroides TaxID=273540 RepID=A0A9Q0HBT2_9MAGN|nr:hypothetical protein NE237_023605 [Protea cynaroides]
MQSGRASEAIGVSDLISMEVRDDCEAMDRALSDHHVLDSHGKLSDTMIDLNMGLGNRWYKKKRRWTTTEKEKNTVDHTGQVMNSVGVSESGRTKGLQVVDLPRRNENVGRRSFADVISGNAKYISLSELVVEGGLIRVVVPQIEEGEFVDSEVAVQDNVVISTVAGVHPVGVSGVFGLEFEVRSERVSPIYVINEAGEEGNSKENEVDHTGSSSHLNGATLSTKPSRVEVVFSDIATADNDLQDKEGFTKVEKSLPSRPPRRGKKNVDKVSASKARLARLETLRKKGYPQRSYFGILGVS